MNTQVGKQANQIYDDPSHVIIPILRSQMMYTAPIIMIQVNKSKRWPPLILLNCEWQRTGLVWKGSMARPYQSTLKYPN
jgi:hypothetical protein